MPLNCSVFAGVHSELPRTCNCLTQNLHCHGCGDNIGYVVASPCSLCLPRDICLPSSCGSPPTLVASTHRFIFLCSRVTWEERLFVPGDKDIARPSTFRKYIEGVRETRDCSDRLLGIEPGDVLLWHHLLTKGHLRADICDRGEARASRRLDSSLSPRRHAAAR